MDFDGQVSCLGFPSDSTTSTGSGLNFPADSCTKKHEQKEEKRESPSCSELLTTSSSTSSTMMSTGLFNSDCRLPKTDRKQPPNIGYETSIAKSILQQYSTLSGDNLFDHLSDIIKRVIDERPPNVIDFFEEFSRNVREQKFHLPERFPPDAIYEENRMYRVAKRMLLSLNLNYTGEQQDFGGDEMELEDIKSEIADDLKIEIVDNDRRFITFNERVQQLQFYWNQCGFSISSEDIFQLACSMNRLQTHSSITQCRFWGVINGLKASYYIVEASLTFEEINDRIMQMETELIEQQREMKASQCEEPVQPTHVGPELTPGVNGWENYPPEELAKMVPSVDPIPEIMTVEVFDVPPEPIGLGVNRFSYFVVNSLADNWIELPVTTPKQIITSREIKKFFTGDLEAEVVSYPSFPGKEKHYLRAMISRITAGTYIAPRGYYRKMTKREKRLFDGIDDGEMEEEEEEEEFISEENDDIIDNDILLLKNKDYQAMSLNMLLPLDNWVHVRPNILQQGRIVWFDVVKAQKDREKIMARLLRMQMDEEMEEEEEEEAEEEGEGEGEEEQDSDREVGPPMLNPCDLDSSDDYTVPWVTRFTSKYTNANERVLVIHSNIWPGAYTFTFENVVESVYMGWGHKYNSRNMPFVHLGIIGDEYVHLADDFVEAIDPTPEEEEAYRLSLIRKQLHPDDGAENFEDDETLGSDETPTEDD